MERERIEQAMGATRKILDRNDVRAGDIEILHSSNNLVLRLHPLPVVAKVATGGSFHGTDPNLELSVARHLQTKGVSCVVPSTVLPVQVYTENGYQMTFWEYFEGEVIENPDRNQSLILIAQLHEALASFPWEGLPKFEAKLDECIQTLDQASFEMPGLPEMDRTFLSRIFKELKISLNNLSIKTGIIHGDCRPYNLLWNNQGKAKWIDFEPICIGPLIWDYLSFFGSKDKTLEPWPYATEILSGITHACVATWCWRKKARSPKEQEAAEFHLEELKRKYQNH